MAEEQTPPHIILFTGHMLDAAGRRTPRFPPESEELAREMIRLAVDRIASEERSGKVLMGISGGASGGDIIFQEVCTAMGIRSKLYLALPKDKYIASSVTPAGEAWRQRFDDLYTKNESEILQKNEYLTSKLNNKKQYSIWEIANLWILSKAMVLSKDDFTLIALWDGKQGDGPGGTKDMVARSQARGARCIHLDAKLLLDSHKNLPAE